MQCIALTGFTYGGRPKLGKPSALHANLNTDEYQAHGGVCETEAESVATC